MIRTLSKDEIAHIRELQQIERMKDYGLQCLIRGLVVGFILGAVVMLFVL